MAMDKFTLKMNISKLAEQAGFVLWDEGDKKGMVDWASEYDSELELFAHLVVRDRDDALMQALDALRSTTNVVTDPGILLQVHRAMDAITYIYSGHD